MLGAKHSGKDNPAKQIPPLSEQGKGKQEDTEKVPVVLEMDVVDDEERGGPDEKEKGDAAAEGRKRSGEKIGGE